MALYRRNVDITEQSNSALSGYQVKLTFGSGDHVFDKAASDGSDIRFYDSDDSTLLNHYIHTFDAAGETAEIWVKVPSLSASTTETYYMYYGDGQNVQPSDGVAVFETFDHFDDGSVDPKWSFQNTTYSESGSVISIGSDTTSTVAAGPTVPDQDIVVQMRYYIYGGGSGESGIGTGYPSDASGRGEIYAAQNWGAEDWSIRAEDMSSAVATTGGSSRSTDVDEWNHLELRVDGASTTAYLTAEPESSDTTNLSGSYAITWNDHKVGFHTYQSKMDVDWIWARKFAGENAEPTVSYGTVNADVSGTSTVTMTATGAGAEHRSATGSSAITATATGTVDRGRSVSGSSAAVATATGAVGFPVTAITTLPDAQQPTLGNGVEDEISANWTDVTDNGEYDLQVRETGASTWVDWASLPESTTSDIITGREDGEEYEVRLRTQTEHVTGAWTTPVSIVTKFPGAAGLSVSSVGETSVTITWTDNSDNEDGFEIWRADEKDNRRDTGYTSFQKVATVAANTTSYQDTGLEDNYNYKYYIRAFTEHTSADSSTVQTTTELTITPGWFLELRKDGDKVAVENEHIVDVSIQPEASGVGKWIVKIPESPYASTWKRAEAYLRYDQTLLMRGELTETRDQESTAEISLEGKDIIEQLKRGGAAVTYSNIEAHKALRDYLGTYTSFAYTVHQPASQTIESNKVVQDADTTTELSNLFTPAADQPFEARSGRLDVLQTNFLAEGEDPTTSSGADQTDIADFSSGFALRFDAAGETASYEFTTSHDIPESAVSFYVRDTGNDTPEIEFKIDGVVVETLTQGVSDLVLGWTDVATGTYSAGGGWTGGTLAAGTHSLTIECTKDPSASGGEYDADIVALLDNRWHLAPGSCDNTTDSNGALATPQLHPNPSAAVPIIQTTVHDDTYNIAHSDLSGTFDDTSGGQLLQVTNNGGANWFPNDGTEKNTSSISVDFSTVGTDIVARVGLSGYGTQTSTPTQGVQGQSIDTWTLYIDTNSIRVIDSQNLAGSHFSNIDQLCEIAGMVFVPVYTENQLELEVFEPGQVTKTVPWEPNEVLDYEFVDTTEGYANQVTVYGAVDSSTGTRYQATASSQTEIDRIGETVPDVVFDPSLKSDAAVENKAAAEVARRIANDTVTGWLEIVPKYIQPGYAYQVPQFDNTTVTLQSAQLQLHSEGMRLDFEQRADLAQVLNTVSIQIGRTRAAIE